MTGGGVYPALAVLQTLKNRVDEVLWVGSEGGIENELITRLGIPFRSIPAAGLHGVGIKRLPGNLNKLARGYQKARRIITEFKPDVFFSTGGYLSVPVAFAAHNVPSVIFIPDVEPGLALKVLIRSADHILTSTEESSQFIANKRKITLVGYPLRQDVTRWDKKNGRKEFGLSDDKPVILVFGGSKGARSINQALFPILPDLLQKAQVIHISGKHNWEETQQEANMLDETGRKDYHPFPYLHENMGGALAAADMVVCRAGASTLGELPYFNLPAILVPYPYAWRYQKTNADHLVKAGGAVLLKDEEMRASLQSTIAAILDHPEKMDQMKKKMGALSTPTAAKHIGDIICEAAQARCRKEQN